MATGKTVGVLGCGSSGKQATGTGGQGGGGNPPAITESTTFTTKPNTELDLLFVIDDAASTTVLQSKLNAQLPTFLSVLQSLPATLSCQVCATGDTSPGC
ncbi:MAG TPA: hypothetical protein VH853_17985 [Polyangia bacterium]|nr:hypothetical protein [Polyangia bacterium]